MSDFCNEENGASCGGGDDEGDIFHSIVMAEQSSWSRGFSEGQQDGRQRSYQDGFHLGAEKGVEFGREVGFYAGYASHIKELNQGNQAKERVVKVCDSILQMADSCKGRGPMDESLTESLSKLQAKFKQGNMINIQTNPKTVIVEVDF